MTTTVPDRTPPDPHAFAHVRHWVFDLDNTLYSGESSLFPQIDRRMGEFVAGLLDLDFEAARRLQKQYFREHGTTLRGLMLHHGVDPVAYMDFVHDIDLSVMEPNPALDAALAALPGPKTIFTNASRNHALAVIERLGIADRFETIFDIHEADYVPKPEAETYARFVARCGVDPAKTALFEDTAANLAPAAALGMTTVLVRPGEAGVVNDADAPYIHHVADGLADWLAALARPTVPAARKVD